MGIHLAHDIRIRLVQLKFYFFASWLGSVKFTFFSIYFCSKWAWSPPVNATQWFCQNIEKSWKKYFFEMILFWENCENNIFSKKNLRSFFNILKELLLVQKQMIPQQKSLILSFLQLESLRAWHHQEGSTPTCFLKTLKKKVNLTKLSQDAKFIFLIAPFLFLHYELSVCPLILNYNKVYLPASLIAKPN